MFVCGNCAYIYYYCLHFQKKGTELSGSNWNWTHNLVLQYDDDNVVTITGM